MQRVYEKIINVFPYKMYSFWKKRLDSGILRIFLKQLYFNSKWKIKQQKYFSQKLQQKY